LQTCRRLDSSPLGIVLSYELLIRVRASSLAETARSVDHQATLGSAFSYRPRGLCVVKDQSGKSDFIDIAAIHFKRHSSEIAVDHYLDSTIPAAINASPRTPFVAGLKM